MTTWYDDVSVRALPLRGRIAAAVAVRRPTERAALWATTVPRWCAAAARVGVTAADCTFEVIDSRRDADPCYAGSVRIGTAVVDLALESDGQVRVVTDGRYGM